VTTTTQHVVADWTAEGRRPAGQPGEVGRNHGAGAAWSYPAVKDAEGRVWFWRDTTDSAGRWILAPVRLAESFAPGEEWQADCDHNHTGRSYFDKTPWRTCDTEADCLSLRREHERTWGR